MSRENKSMASTHSSPLSSGSYPAFDTADIDRLVETFYRKIGTHPRLGPIFTSRNGGDWQPHLAKMKLFWRSILLKTGEYKGSPPQVHMGIGELESSDFDRWIVLFEETSTECLAPTQADIANEYARRIARSLWLSCFGSAFDTPPL